MKITTCPSCGSKKIKRVRRNLKRTVQGRSYVVPNLEFEECPDCGERLFDREAMRLIESYSAVPDKAKVVNKQKRNKKATESDMLPEYKSRQWVRAKYARR